MNDLVLTIFRLCIALLLLAAGIFNIDWLLYSRRRGYDQGIARIMAIFIGTLWTAFEIFQIYMAFTP